MFITLFLSFHFIAQNFFYGLKCHNFFFSVDLLS